MFKVAHYFFLLLGLFNLSFSGAAEISTEELNLAQCLERARSQSLSVIQSVLEEAQAKAEYQLHSRQRLPQFYFAGRLAVSNLLPEQLSDANRASVRMEQKLNPFSPSWKQAEQKHLQWEAAVSAKAENWQDAMLAVKKLYAAVLRSSEIYESLAQIEQELSQVLSSASLGKKRKKTSRYESIRLKLVLADISRAVLLARSEFETEWSRLAQMIGMRPGEVPRLEPIRDLRELPELGQLSAKTDSNPTLKTLSFHHDAAKVGLLSAHYSRLPEITAGFDYGYGGPIGSSMVPGWEASLLFRMPLFDWGVTSAHVEVHSLAAQLARNKLEQERQRIHSDLTEVYTHARAQLADYRRLRSILPEIQNEARASMSRFPQGQLPQGDAIDAIELWMETFINERNSFYSYWIDLAILERLSGTAQLLETHAP